MLELGFITQQEYEECCILLLKSMYGNIDAALKFFCTYKAHLLKVMRYKQSLADPCVFYKKNDKDQTVLFALIQVDDLLLVGTKEELKTFKAGIKKRFGFTDLGKLQKLLGVWYKEKSDENGERYLVAMMPELVDDIIKLYEKHTGQSAKEYETPGTPGECTEKHEDNAVDHEMYRKLTGKIMYLVPNC
jgi:hypothetical protein